MNMKKEIKAVDVHNDAEMIALGIRLPNYEDVDWTKTFKEKKALKKVRNNKYKFSKGISRSEQHVPLKDTLIIHVAKNNKYKTYDKKHNRTFYQTTFSHKCWYNEIPKILGFFDKVISYTWNGKTYSIGELPYWHE